jgi:hypothetical protein
MLIAYHFQLEIFQFYLMCEAWYCAPAYIHIHQYFFRFIIDASIFPISVSSL